MTNPQLGLGDDLGTSGALPRILVVDDTPDIRLLLRLALDVDGGFEIVGEASDGVEAIEAAGRLLPDVVLLDLAMPVMDGLEALPQIHAISPASKIIVLSGFNAREMGSEALRLGASSYMEKGDIARRLGPHIASTLAGGPDARTVVPVPDRSPVPHPATVPEDQADTSADLLSVLTHELDNPVTVLQGFAMLLQHGTESMSPDLIKDSAAAIVRASRHLGALVEACADMRKVEVEALDLLLEPSDISELVRETVGDMASVTGSHPVRLEVAHGAVASADPLRVRQVLINLVANAAKFSPDGTRIEVTVARVGDFTEVSVRDHGPGIRTDDLSALFKKFARLNPKVPGTGLGLFVSRGIARAHGGDLILAESSAPGCRFVLRLPLLPESGANG